MDRFRRPLMGNADERDFRSAAPCRQVADLARDRVFGGDELQRQLGDVVARAAARRRRRAHAAERCARRRLSWSAADGCGSGPAAARWRGRRRRLAVALQSCGPLPTAADPARRGGVVIATDDATVQRSLRLHGCVAEPIWPKSGQPSGQPPLRWGDLNVLARFGHLS